MSDRPRTDAVPRLADLSQNWRRRAEELRPFAEPAARAFKMAADELEEALDAEGDELVTITEAARRSGFSPDHLGRLVRDGKVPNRGRPHAPRIRLADVPRKAGALPLAGACATLVGATPRQLAAAIATTG